MSLDYCAIDFETANEHRGSPCAVGLVKVVDGDEIARAHWLMRPPESVDYFNAFNIGLHGITPAMVRGEPRFAERLPEIVAFADGLPLVAHNAAFDLGVVRDAADASGIAWPTVTYACTLVLARRTYDLLSYSLPWVAEAAGVPLDRHHDPAADAAAAAGVLLAIAGRWGVETLDELLAAAPAHLGTLAPGEWNGCGVTGNRAIPTADPDANPDHPFYGRYMAFTGALLSMGRDEARALVAASGAQPEAGVTKHTNILVEGYQDPSKLRPGEALSAKARKAEEARARGQPIEIMDESDFLQLLRM